MTTPTAVRTPTAAPPVRHPWGIVFLLFAAMLVSFFDRGNLAVAAPVMAPEFGLSQVELGLLFSAFFWTYSVSLLGAGWLVDRIDVRWVYAAGFFLWSVATFSTAFATSFSALLCMRMLLGIGESVVFPANSRVLASAFWAKRRGLSNGIIGLGGRLGPLFGTLIGALLITRVGWRGLFLISGLGGLVWLVPWLVWAPRARAAAPAVADAKPVPTWGWLLKQRDVWGTCGGLFGANYAWYFLLSYIPSYLVRERHFSMNSLAVWGALPYLFMALSCIGGGILSDRWISRGASAIRVRRGFATTGLVLSAVLLPLALLPRVEFAIAGLVVSNFAFGIYVSNLWALTQTLAGPLAAGRWTGVQNAFGNLAGVLSPAVTGWLVDRTGHFSFAFLAASLACFVGAASFRFLIRDPSQSR